MKVKSTYNRICRNLSAGLNIELITPDTSFIIVTGQCNSKCQMCTWWKKPKTVELSVNQWYNILDKLLDFGIKKVGFLGGEPTLRNDIDRLIKYAKRIGFEQVQITTNGLIIKPILNSLDSLDRIIISIDSLKSDAYFKIRGVDMLPIVLKNMEKIIKNGGNVTLSFCIQKDNYTEINEYINAGIRMGVKSFSFMPVSDNTILDTAPPNNELKDYDLSVVKTQLAEWYGKVTIIPSSNHDLLFQRVESSFKHPCDLVYSFFDIAPNGDVYPCCGNLPKVGNLMDNTMEEIWSSNGYRNVRRMALNGDNLVCQSCLHIGRIYDIKKKIARRIAI